MAEFSKQWAEVNDPEFPWDFDIEEEFESIPHGYYKPMICEGFGFMGLLRTTSGSKALLFDNGTDELETVDYIKFMKQQKQKINGIT